MGLDMYLIKRKKDKKKLTDNELWNFDNELIYWRKANMVHNYLCSAGEEIEEERSYKISKEVLKVLLDKCNEVLDKVKLDAGKVKNGKQLKNGEWEDILEDGVLIVNQDEIGKILPTTSGFFFGSTEYDQYYLEDIKYTKEQLENIIDKIDYDNEDVYYLASW